MARRRKRQDWFVCPHCGAKVKASARACPECGSDERTGWAEDADRWAAGAPTGYAEDDEFDYEEFVRREFGPPRRFRRNAVLAFVLIALLILVLILGQVL